MDVAITLTLPEATVEKAQAAGLLTPERLSALVEAEIERQQQAAPTGAAKRDLEVAQLFRDLERLQKAVAEEGITPADLEAELATYYAEEQQREANG